MNTWRIAILTRNSARYVTQFLKNYRELEIEPLYIVDGRSDDGTEVLLRDAGADVHLVNPEDSFGVTELLQAAAEIARTDWIIRLDDDEFPSMEMIAFIRDKGASDSSVNYSFKREWVRRHRQELMFFRRYYNKDEILYDPQVRMLRNDNLEFDHSIHTVGILHRRHVESAPVECFIAHFDAIIKSPAEQLAKVRRYEKITPGSAWAHAD